MRNCDVPLRSSVADYDKCVGLSRNPKKGGLQNRRPDVTADYATYRNQGARAHSVPQSGNWPLAEAGWQRSLYDETYEGGWLEEIRTEVFKAAKGRCVLCSVFQPRTLDHFLPKESWPSLSVLTLNLVAACADCNRIKGTLANASPGQQFVHPYFDAVPMNEVFLHCSPVKDGVMSPGFSIESCAGMDNDLLARLRWQFDTLELDEMYRDEAMLFFGERKDDWRESAEIDWITLARQIERECSSAAKATGRNMWKPAFLQGLLDCPSFGASPLTFLGQ
ncbi:5-methylcytosine-specific restriction endonuclease McrA [Agrobacterium fabrum]|nr:5-methylcytosine-specific restriction endonuclease McrA [Agrobacterium fabrum]